MKFKSLAGLFLAASMSGSAIADSYDKNTRNFIDSYQTNVNPDNFNDVLGKVMYAAVICGSLQTSDLKDKDCAKALGLNDKNADKHFYDHKFYEKAGQKYTDTLNKLIKAGSSQITLWEKLKEQIKGSDKDINEAFVIALDNIAEIPADELTKKSPTNAEYRPYVQELIELYHDNNEPDDFDSMINKIVTSYNICTTLEQSNQDCLQALKKGNSSAIDSLYIDSGKRYINLIAQSYVSGSDAKTLNSQLKSHVDSYGGDIREAFISALGEMENKLPPKPQTSFGLGSNS